MEDFNPNKRLSDVPDHAHRGIRRVEMNFAIPVAIASHQYTRLCDFMEEVTGASWNTPEGGVHWFSFQGSSLRSSWAITSV